MVRNLLSMIIKWTAAISFIFFVLAMFAPRLLMRLYTPDPELIRIGASYLRIVSVSYLFVGVTQCYFTVMKVEGHVRRSVIISGVFPAGGDARYDAVSVFFASWCFALPLALLGTFVFHWPVMLVYVVMCADEIVKLPFIYPRYRKFLWLKDLTRDAETAA